MLTDSQQQWLHSERIKLLTSMAPFAAVATAINAGLLTVILWKPSSPVVLLSWLACMLTIAGLQYVLVYKESPRWETWFIAGAALSGFAWGSASIILFPRESLGAQVFLALIIGALAAKAVPVLSPLLSAYVAYILASLLPITIRFLIMRDEIHLAMGALGVGYMIVMLVTARRAHQMFMTSLTLRLEKNSLIENLTAEINERTRLEAELRRAHDVLDEKVKERTAELVQANSILSTEINERKRVENALRESQELFRLIMENVEDLIAVLDIEGRRIYNNAAYRRLFGVPEALYGTDSFRSVHQEDRDRIKRIFFETIRTGVAQRAEYRFVTHDGMVRIVESLGNVIRDQEGRVVNLVVVSRDITERKQAEEKIRQQAALLDVAHDAILVVDLEGRILFWNQGATAIYGWTAEETIQKMTDAILYRHLPAPWEDARRALLEHGQWRGEMKHLTKHGKEVIVESHWTLVRSSAGLPVSILKVNSDITDKKLLEKKFLHAQRMESLGTMAGGIAHDINNVLTPIILAVQLLKMKPLDQESQQWLDGIKYGAERAARLIKQVLFFAKGVEGERAPVVVQHLVTELETILTETFPRSISIRTVLAPDLWVVVGDFTQLYQVLMNLCVNARDAMPNGGRLEIEASNSVIDTETARRDKDMIPGRYVALSVMDSGTGMTPEIMEKVFDPFFTTKEQGKGTGLGLSTVLGITKRHGGFVTVKSEIGAGTRVTMYIPAESLPPSLRAVEQRPALSEEHGNLVLVVDDEAGVLKMTKALLTAHGYQVLTAANGSEAVALYREHQARISVVMTDMMMPVMDGEATIRALRAVDPKVTVIAVSGLGNEQVLELGDADRISFLSKPYTPDKLLALLKHILGQSVPARE